MPEEAKMIFMKTFLRNLKRELMKNWKKRIEYALLIAFPFVFLADEAAKEGYLFSLSDFFQTAYVSHEQLIVASLALGFVVRWINGNSVRPEAAH